jgi:transcriptional regulator with GAF, ATPase, and Fis domain
LFGHVQGAFTGALRDKRGRFEVADGGTLFLDEVGEISPAIQVKLLRVLQDHAIERVGDEKTIPVDIRIIAATNRPLGELVSAGRFRLDLFYRLRVMPIRLPPLRERRDDIPLLAQHFVDKTRQRTGRAIEGVDETALSVMLDYHWPGNVRELENIIEYAFIKARNGLINEVHLPPELRGQPAIEQRATAFTFRRTRRTDLTAEIIRETLISTGWNVAKTARRLKTTRNTIYQRVYEFGLRPPED